MSNRLDSVTHGDDRELTLTILDGSEPVDISGFSAISARFWAGDAGVNKSLGSGIALTTDGTDGQATITFDAGDWVAFENVDFQLRIEVQTVDGGGKINTPVRDLKWQVYQQEIT